MRALDVALGYSLRHAILLLFLHAIAAIVVSATAMPVAVMIASNALILMSLSYYFSRDILRRLPDSWIGISLMQDGISVGTRDGGNFHGRVEKRTVVSPWLLVLRVVPEGQRFPVSRAIFPDTLEAGAFRELCVRLRFS